MTSAPSELTGAIDQAAAEYGVPADVLMGQWRMESGSSFPNPYVNSSGFGGLFGLSTAQAAANKFSLLDPGSYAAQAKVAAADLANNIRATGGNLAAALSRYSGGGYTSVPGETTFGTVPVPAAQPYVIPGLGASQPVSTSGGIPTVLTGPGSAAAGAQGQVSGQAQAQGVPGSNIPIIGGAIGMAALLFGGLFRIILTVLGVVAILIGFYILFKPDDAPGAGDLAKTAVKAAPLLLA